MAATTNVPATSGMTFPYRRSAAAAESYLGVGRHMNAALAPGAAVLGADRWWWALSDHPYFSIHVPFLQWMVRRAHRPAHFAELVEQGPASFIVVNNDVRGILTGYPDELQGQFWEFCENARI